VRLLTCLAALVLLTGCNIVITHKPLFVSADGAPAPRPGLWRLDFGDACKVDESRPLSEWPSCADGVVLGAGKVGYYDRNGENPVWTTEPLVLAAGQPIVGQAQVKVSGDMKLTGDIYAYVGIRPSKLDAAGRFTRFKFWPVQCGPPSAGGDFTEHPAEGVRVEPVAADASASQIGRLCTIDDPTAMRRVAAQSEAWAPKKGVGRWVRDRAD
jgi:hypothetical protein